MSGQITDIEGIRVGHCTDLQAITGCTVLLCEEGAVGGVDIRGSASGTRELDPLSPLHLVERIHGLLLAGGSAFGLDAAGGAMDYLEERGVGFDVGVTRVPDADPRISTPPTAPSSHSRTVQPVMAWRSVQCPTHIPSMSVICPFMGARA